MNSLSSTRKRGFVLTLGFVTAMAAFSIDASLPAVPAMVEALGSQLSRGQQIVGVFMAGMAIGQIPAGLASDRLGRLPVMYAGMALFALAATVAAFANDIEVMLAARFVQGAGGASAIVLSRAIVRDVASGKEAARLMSLMMLVFTAAPVIAPTIGAILVTLWGWRAPFIAIAAFGYVILLAVRRNIVETHTADNSMHPVRQLLSSFSMFFSYRQSIFGLLLIILTPAGFMSVIATSSALVVQTYGYSVTAFGLIFACAGLSVMIGAAINRLLVARFDLLQMIGIGVSLAALSAVQLFIIAWLDSAPLWWLWMNVCTFFFTVAILVPNANVVALDPLPKIAGVASSIIGTLQNLIGAASALFAAAIYDGSVRNSVIIMASAGGAIVLVFLLRPLIVPGPFVHHGE